MSECKIVIPPGASQVHNQSPLIAEYSNWLPTAEVEKILLLAPQLPWYQGKTADRVLMKSLYQPEVRIAENHKVGKTDPECLASLGKKVAEFLKLPSKKYIEPTLLVRYQPGGHFITHTDRWEAINSDGITTNRQATFMVYLNTDYQGGRTHFPTVNATIEPDSGKGLLFTYCEESTDNYKFRHHPVSYHSGQIVTVGTKLILIFFIRDNEFTDDLRTIVKY